MNDNVISKNALSTAKSSLGVVRLISTQRSCSDMQSAVKSDNTLTHQASGALYQLECK
jgi:hypothetical protein